MRFSDNDAVIVARRNLLLAGLHDEEDILGQSPSTNVGEGPGRPHFLELPTAIGAIPFHALAQSRRLGEIKVNQHAMRVSGPPVAHGLEQILRHLLAVFGDPLFVGGLGGVRALEMVSIRLFDPP